jgi:hypothetical protein
MSLFSISLNLFAIYSIVLHERYMLKYSYLFRIKALVKNILRLSFFFFHFYQLEFQILDQISMAFILLYLVVFFKEFIKTLEKLF